MQILYSTAELDPRNKFKLWRERLVELFGSFDQTRLDDGPFEGMIEATRVGSLSMSRVTQGAVRHAEQGRKHRDATDTILAVFKLSGTSRTLQEDRAAIQRAGDLVLLNHRPAMLETFEAGQSVVVELPRARLESVLGPSSLYTSLTICANIASASLASSFVHELIRVGGALTPDAAERMASVSIDLIVATLAERMAREVPRPLHGSMVVQRAKAYVEANLSDPTLDPPHLAAAMGVSLRRLQELFHERGQHISDWIWERRLAVAARRLADPVCLHLPIGTLAYDCGFTSQAHFSRRFKDHYGLTPSEYKMATALKRSRALLGP